MKIITDKYHTILRKKTLLCDLSTRNITIAYLLAYYLGSSCEKYNNEIDLETYLDKYYGINYNVSLSKVGNKILFTYTMNYVDPKYVNDDNYTNIELDNVFKTITTPYLLNGKLDSKHFNKCKKMYLIDLREIESDEEDKAKNNLFHYYFKNTIRDYKSNGSVDILNSLNEDEVLEFYNELIKSEKIEYLVGNVEEYNDSIDTLKPQDNFKYKIRNEINDNFIIDKAKTKSAYLLIIIDPKIFAGDILFDAISLYCYFLGQSSYSMLFKNVREKDNLCYGIRSSYYGSTGLGIISAQINKKNLDKALESIKYTINHSLDNFNLEELKDKYYKQNKPNNDYINSLVEEHFYNNYFKDLSNINFKDRINNIKFEDIKKIKELFMNFSFIYLYGGDLK